jgi:uncharacterized protein
MIQKQLKFEIKSVSDEGKFTGFAAYYGNVDSDNEVLDPNCFKRSISHTKGRGIPVLWAHDTRMPIAWGVSAEETKDGLQVEAQFLLNTEQGRAAYEWAKMGTALDANVGISVGFRPVKDGAYYKDGRKHYREAQLAEYSLCVFQANDRARVATVKSDGKIKRVDGEDLESGAFLIIGDETDPSTWKLPVRFSSDAKTTRHIRNALARFNQLKDVSAADKARAFAELKRLAKEHGIETGDGKAQKDFNDSLAEAQRMDALYQDRCAMERALYDAVQGTLGDDTMSADDKKADIAASYEQYAEAMSGWYSRFIDADTDNDNEEDDMDGKQEKAGRAISAASAQQIKMAMGHLMDAGALHQKALGILTDLSKQPYTANDVNAPNPVGGKSEAEELAEKAATEKAAAEAAALAAQEKSDSEALHSLLELTRSVADRSKAA